MSFEVSWSFWNRSYRDLQNYIFTLGGVASSAANGLGLLRFSARSNYDDATPRHAPRRATRPRTDGVGGQVRLLGDPLTHGLQLRLDLLLRRLLPHGWLLVLAGGCRRLGAPLHRPGGTGAGAATYFLRIITQADPTQRKACLVQLNFSRINSIFWII